MLDNLRPWVHRLIYGALREYELRMMGELDRVQLKDYSYHAGLLDELAYLREVMDSMTTDQMKKGGSDAV